MSLILNNKLKYSLLYFIVLKTATNVKCCLTPLKKNIILVITFFFTVQKRVYLKSKSYRLNICNMYFSRINLK